MNLNSCDMFINAVNKFYSIFSRKYKRLFWSYERQAIDAGVILGEGNFIDSSFWSSEPYLIKVGNHCQITEGVKIYTHGGAGAARKWYPEFDTFGKVVLGDYVYLGSGTKIMPGVTIGDNVLVAAGSIVTKSVPSNVVVAGNPARFICSIDEYIKNNMKYNVNTKGLTSKEKKEVLLKMEESKFIIKPQILSE